MMAEDWEREWERRIVNGLYPLRRFLGRSNHSVVFLTECPAQNVAQAAIKILPAIPALAEAQLAQWNKVASLSHPHLVRLIDAGRCQLGGHNFLFVVMELAQQNLAQILRGRPLDSGELRDLLPATLDALAYIHGKNLVHGGLKPANFLAVDDRLKLASDTIRPAGERGASIAKPSLYDPPEARKGRMSTTGDVWGLGMTLVEALTQSAPVWSRDRSDDVSLPADMAPEFVDTLRRCLNRDPAQRPSIADLAAQFQQAPAAPAASTEAPDMMPSPEMAASTVSAPNSLRTRSIVIAAIVLVVALCAVWAAVHLVHGPPTVPQDASLTRPSPPAVAAAAAVETSNSGIGASLPTVLHQEIPDVTRRSHESVRGVINVTVRVTVDRSGSVVAATLVDRASSKYFNRAAVEAAKKWKFATALEQASRMWLLNFEFTRADTTAHATALQAGN